MKVSTQLEKILDNYIGPPDPELVALLLSLIETLVDDAYIAGTRRKQPPTIE